MKNKFFFNVFIKTEDNLFIAHCLELDIVATGNTIARAQKDMVELIKTQILYAFSNDNLDHLFKMAPAEVWQEYLACKNKDRPRREYKVSRKANTSENRLFPEIFETEVCSEELCLHA